MQSTALAVAEILTLILRIRLIAWTLVSCQAYLGKKMSLSSVRRCEIAVIVPAYNEEAEIVRTLAAIETQDSPVAEVIIIDDGSTDKTAALAAEALRKCPNGKLLRNPANLGKAAALNKALEISRANLIATVDADTRLSSDALNIACRELALCNADAMALSVEIPRNGGLLCSIQRQKYALGHNFERAGQAYVGAILVMPGAATLFRRTESTDLSFSSRSQTEDADLTLTLSGQGRRAGFAMNARASTVPPLTVRRLLRQRVRWTLGHMQCSVLHLRKPLGPWRHWALTLPNFIISTWVPVLLLIVSVIMSFGDAAALLKLTLFDVWFGSAMILYGQRLIAAMFVGFRPEGITSFVLEPLLTSVLNAASTLLALPKFVKWLATRSDDHAAMRW